MYFPFSFVKPVQTVIIIATWLIFNTGAQAQYTNQEQTMIFSNRLKHPIEIEVNQNQGKYTFYAKSKSFFTYTLTLEFKNITNLTPYITKQTFEVKHGTNRLLALSVTNPELAPNYQYSFSYKLQSSESTLKQHLYLYPFGAGKKVSEYQFIENNQLVHNTFNMHIGDTVYAVRKGIVVANLKKETDEERLMGENSIEVLHQDGTLLAYCGIQSETGNLVSKGQIVYPGQPLAVITKTDTPLRLYLVKVLDGGQGLSQRIKYHNDCTAKLLTNSNADCISNYPENIITEEMSAIEIRRCKKGKLYTQP